MCLYTEELFSLEGIQWDPESLMSREEVPQRPTFHQINNFGAGNSNYLFVLFNYLFIVALLPFAPPSVCHLSISISICCVLQYTLIVSTFSSVCPNLQLGLLGAIIIQMTESNVIVQQFFRAIITRHIYSNLVNML